MKKKRKIILLAVLLVCMMFIYILWPKNSSKQADAMNGMPPTKVDVLTLKEEAVPLYQEMPGRTTAYQVAEIRPQVNGIITERLFEEGSEVNERQQLYQVDAAPYQATYARAKADLAKAEANLKTTHAKSNRISELLKKNAVSKQDFDDISAELSQAYADIAIAKAAIAQAKINLDYTKVYAPISGIIGKSRFTKGALVTANQMEPLTTITRLDPIFVDLTQASSEIMFLRRTLQEKEKLPVSLYVEDENEKYAHEGVLQFSDVTVDESTGSVSLRALFPNPDSILLPGLFVRAQVKLKTANAILIPQSAVIRGADGNTRVWVMDDENKVSLRPITVQFTYQDKWLIKDGVQAGEKILLNGFQKIAPGAKVIPTSEQPNEQSNEQPSQGDQ